MRKLTKWTGIFFIVLLVNTAYVAAFSSPTIFYMSNVLLHLALGLALAMALLLLLQREPELRGGMSAATGCFVFALGLGVFLAGWGNTLDHRWALIAHIAVAGAGVLALIPFVLRKASQNGGEWIRFKNAFLAATALLAIFPASAYFYHQRFPDPSDHIRNPMTAPLTMDGEGAGPKSPFFPSSANTNVNHTIPSPFFMDSELCGTCHVDIYNQWKSSSHHFASFNNQFYRKSIEYMQDVVGTRPSKWCAGCHDHAVFFNGRFDRPMKEQVDTPEAHAGLACTSCHSIVHVDSSMGNAGIVIEYPPLHDIASSKNVFIRAADRFLTFLNPGPHKRTFLKPFMRGNSAEFCSACHKVHLDVPVNGYRWFRGFNDYDAWQASGVSGQGARSFYYPEKSSVCVDCHMPLVPSRDPGNHSGKVHSHRFPAANTALAYANHDPEQMKAEEDFLKSGFITVDIFGASPIDTGTGGTAMVRRTGEGPQAMSSIAAGEEAEQSGQGIIRDVGKLAAPINHTETRFKPGSTVRVDVVVRTRKIGHAFPGGTLDAFDIWTELQATDVDGKVVFWSGSVEDGGKGPVEPGAHFYKSYQLDGDGNPINKRNAWQARSVLYVHQIPPGAADVVHYRVQIPKDAKGPITLTAKLNHRKFSNYYTKFSYAGQPKPGQDPSLLGPDHNSMEYSFEKTNVPQNVSGEIKGEIPAIPITTLAKAQATLALGDPKAEPDWKPVVKKEDRERWNDWGIGLLAQGDLKGAEYAFKQATVAEPGYADGWLNVARALIQEGETEAAKPYIEKALAVNSKLGRIHYFKALIQKADGDYDGALASLRVVTGLYPRDRVVLNQMARILFLKREYAEALKVLDQVCLIDPEDLQMHYTKMLAFRGLQDQTNATREQQLFLRFKAEESSQSITAKRRMISPEDNNERQQIHDHESAPLGAPSVPAKSAKSATAKVQNQAPPQAQPQAHHQAQPNSHPAAQPNTEAVRTVANVRIP